MTIARPCAAFMTRCGLGAIDAAQVADVFREVAPFFWTRNRLALFDGSPNYAAFSVGWLKYTASGVRASSDECGRRES